VPAAIEFQCECGWEEVRARCHALVEHFDEVSGLPIVPDAFGQMASFELSRGDPDETQRRLWDEHRIEVPCFDWNGRPLLRLSVQGYNTEQDVERLVAALASVG
jgi:isopenicillin-N epimerase